ncbi:hypothetical protein, partial [Inquilinus sp.]|uniref:hypothetical protein n=1 Tax=Inquilinus sp. TaxID=1932117 RepID=UPI003784E8B6
PCGEMDAGAGREKRSGTTVERPAPAGGRRKATLRAVVRGRQGASPRLPDVPHRAARGSCPAGL